MIIEKQEDVTSVVLHEMHRTPDSRTKELLAALVTHLHAFIRETRMTEHEFQQAIGHLNAIGQKTTPSHNEAMLLAGTLGVSNLICLLNNGQMGTQPTQANNLGPFWRTGSPAVADGGSILRSPTAGEPLFFTGRVQDTSGHPVAGVEIDIWQSTPAGLYENQDRAQAEMNLRGKFVSLDDGTFRFRGVKPGPYPVPHDGPAGALLRAQNRHNWRPAHLHFLLFKPGFKTIASQIYVPDDPYLETDSQFGVTKALIGNFVRHENEKPPEPDVTGAWYSLEHGFTLEVGEASLPRAPITAKVAA
ncbi:MAG: dioxygenase [Burkholderiales bacterium]